MGFYETKLRNGTICWKHTDLEDVENHGFLGSGIDARFEEGSILLEQLGISSIVRLKQVHGVEVVSPVFSSSSQGFPCEADGFFIKKGDGACGIKTADCVPLFLVSSDRAYAANLHCGWRSTVDGIVNKAMECFSKAGVRAEDIHAYTGPAAQICCYEIGAEVADIFLDAFSSAVDLSRKNAVSFSDEEFGVSHPVVLKSVMSDSVVSDTVSDYRVHGSVVNIIRAQLMAARVPQSQIHVLNECTICSSEKYYSHRRGSEERQLSFFVL